MSKTTKRTAGKATKTDAQQLAAKRRRDELRRAIARETEIRVMARTFIRAEARAEVAIEALRVYLNERSSEQFAARAGAHTDDVTRPARN